MDHLCKGRAFQLFDTDKDYAVIASGSGFENFAAVLLCMNKNRGDSECIRTVLLSVYSSGQIDQTNLLHLTLATQRCERCNDERD